MKALTFLLTFLLTFWLNDCKMTIPQIRTATKGMKKTCLGKTGVAKELVDAGSKGNYADDKDLGCFYLCILAAMKSVKDGRFNLAAGSRQADIVMTEDMAERAKAAWEDCAADMTADDPCEETLQFIKCSWTKDREEKMMQLNCVPCRRQGTGESGHQSPVDIHVVCRKTMNQVVLSQEIYKTEELPCHGR